jgi:hypothetical protein
LNPNPKSPGFPGLKKDSIAGMTPHWRDGKGEGGVFLRASRIVFCRLKDGVYLKLNGFEVSADLFLFLIVDLVVLDVISLFQMSVEGDNGKLRSVWS